jgi:hypothetical protein
MIRHSSLPLSRLSFATGAKIIISSVETKLDTEALSQLDRGDVKFFLGFKVVKTKVTKDPYTGIAKNFNELNFLILSIEHTSLTSMTLVRLEQGEDLIDFGPYYLEESNTKETHFVVLTKSKRGGQDQNVKESDLSSISIDDKLSVFLINTSNNNIRLSSGLKPDRVMFVDNFAKKPSVSSN